MSESQWLKKIIVEHAVNLVKQADINSRYAEKFECAGYVAAKEHDNKFPILTTEGIEKISKQFGARK